MTVIRPAPAVLAVLLLVAPLVGARPARAELLVGEEAPPLVVTAAVRGPLPSDGGLLGRVVLLEFFATACPHCQAEVAHLNALQRRLGPRGLRVLALSHEPHAAAEAFARAHRVQYDLALVPSDVLRDHDVPSFPRAVLRDAAGRVVWRGHPANLTDADVEAALARGGLLPAVPPSWTWVEEGIAAGRLGALAARLEAVAAAPPDRAAGVAAQALAAWVGWLLGAWTSGAEADESAGRAHDAWTGWRRLAVALEGTPAGARAASRAAALEVNPVAQRELAAGRAFAQARAMRPGATTREALAAFQEVVRRWPGTRAAARAAPFVVDLEKVLRR